MAVVIVYHSYLQVSGNQRDLARERNLKKQLEQKKKAGASAKEGNAGLSTDARKIRDAEVMRLKQEKAAAKKAADDAAKAADQKKLAKIDPLKDVKVRMNSCPIAWLSLRVDVSRIQIIHGSSLFVSVILDHYNGSGFINFLNAQRFVFGMI
ncbi:4F5 family protein [Cooperia oncophora]